MRMINRLQWGGPSDMNKPWRSIHTVKGKVNQQRKGSAISHSVSQPDQHARPGLCGAGDIMRQAQGQELLDKVELEMGDEPPSRSLAV